MDTWIKVIYVYMYIYIHSHTYITHTYVYFHILKYYSIIRRKTPSYFEGHIDLLNEISQMNKDQC